MCHGVLPGHLSRRQNQESRPVKGSKITEPPRARTATSDNCEPADTTPAHRLTAGRTLTGGTAAAGRGQARVLEIGLPTSPETRGGRMRAALPTGRHDGSDLHHHLETRLHPRYGENAVWVSSQCDVPTNEFSAFKLAAWQMPSRNNAHKCRFGTDGRR